MRQIDSAKAIKELGVKYAPKSHSHSYLPLAGGTMTGPLKNSYTTGTYLSGNQGNALVSSLSNAGAYVAMLRYPSTSGYFTFVGYQGSMRLQYTNKATVDAGTNSVTSSITLMDESGNSTFPGTITTNSMNVRNSLLVNNREVIHAGNMDAYDIYRVGAYNKACYNSDGDYRDYLYLGITTDLGNFKPYFEWKGSWRQDPESIKCKIFLESDNRLSDGTNTFLKSNDYQVGMNGIVKDISGKDLRSITVSGRYKGSSCVNAPAGSTWYFYDIEIHNASYRKITARSLFNESEFVCTCNNGKWSSWIELYTTYNKPTPAEIGAIPESNREIRFLGNVKSGTVIFDKTKMKNGVKVSFMTSNKMGEDTWHYAINGKWTDGWTSTMEAKYYFDFTKIKPDGSVWMYEVKMINSHRENLGSKRYDGTAKLHIGELNTLMVYLDHATNVCDNLTVVIEYY